MNILNYGGGVNSTACLILVMEDPRFVALREDLTVIFADTGGEWPETYHYMETVFEPYILKRWGLHVKRVADKITLEERALHDRIAPARVNRWCTDKHKIRPIYRFYKVKQHWPVRQVFGIDYGEVHRMRTSEDPRIEFIYPLVEAKIDREGCKALIRAHGLPIPQKSGCFYCPFQRRSQWVSLARKHPKLFVRAIMMEENASGFPKGRMLSDVDSPLREWVPKRMAQGELFPDLPDQGYCMHGCEVETDDE